MDESDVWDEVRYQELYEEYKAQAVEEFQYERLRAHYANHRELARPLWAMLDESMRICESSPSGALALASAAAEVGVKELFIRPLVAGLTHSEAMAPLLAEVVLRAQGGFDRIKPLLFELLRRFGTLDLDAYHRSGCPKRLWDEIKTNVELRNAVLHRCEPATKTQAQTAIAIAQDVLGNCFEKVITSMGFHLHERYLICSDFHMPDDFAAALKASN